MLSRIKLTVIKNIIFSKASYKHLSAFLEKIKVRYMKKHDRIMPIIKDAFFDPPAELIVKTAALNDLAEMTSVASYYLYIKRRSEDIQDAQKVQDLASVNMPAEYSACLVLEVDYSQKAREAESSI